MRRRPCVPATETTTSCLRVTRHHLRHDDDRRAVVQLAFAAFLSLHTISGAQITFSAAKQVTSGSTSVFTMAPGDINHDAYTDLVVRNVLFISNSLRSLGYISTVGEPNCMEYSWRRGRLVRWSKQHLCLRNVPFDPILALLPVHGCVPVRCTYLALEGGRPVACSSLIYQDATCIHSFSFWPVVVRTLCRLTLMAG